MHTEALLVIERVPHAHAYAHNTQHTYKHTSDGKSNLISGLELKARWTLDVNVIHSETRDFLRYRLKSNRVETQSNSDVVD